MISKLLALKTKIVLEEIKQDLSDNIFTLNLEKLTNYFEHMRSKGLIYDYNVVQVGKLYKIKVHPLETPTPIMKLTVKVE
jgi:hypothetical protein